MHILGRAAEDVNATALTTAVSIIVFPWRLRNSRRSPPSGSPSCHCASRCSPALALLPAEMRTSAEAIGSPIARRTGTRIDARLASRPKFVLARTRASTSAEMRTLSRPSPQQSETLLLAGGLPSGGSRWRPRNKIRLQGPYSVHVPLLLQEAYIRDDGPSLSASFAAVMGLRAYFLWRGFCAPAA